VGELKLDWSIGFQLVGRWNEEWKGDGMGASTSMGWRRMGVRVGRGEVAAREPVNDGMDWSKPRLARRGVMSVEDEGTKSQSMASATPEPDEFWVVGPKSEGFLERRVEEIGKILERTPSLPDEYGLSALRLSSGHTSIPSSSSDESMGESSSGGGWRTGTLKIEALIFGRVFFGETKQK
jgi:hypothetical protein